MNAVYKFFEIGSSLPTITDWIQTICIICYTLIALIGTIFIVRTFRSQAIINQEQKHINSQQAELNRLALEKHRRDIRPIFVVKRSEDASWLTIKVENAPAFKVTFVPKEQFEYYLENVDLYNYSQFFVQRDNISFELSSKYIDENGSHVLDVSFEDEDGRKYKQFLWCEEDDTMSFPKLLPVS